MPLIVDVYNVLHTVGVLPPDLAGIDLEGLRELLMVSRYAAVPTTLVCDGVGPRGLRQVDLEDGDAGEGGRLRVFQDVQVCYSGSGQTADSVIMQAVRVHDAPRRLMVVSSDRQIQKVVRKRRCRILGSDRFLGQLDRDFHRRDPTRRRSGPPTFVYEVPLDRGSVRWWREFFGYPAEEEREEERVEALRRGTIKQSGPEQAQTHGGHQVGQPLCHHRCHQKRSQLRSSSSSSMTGDRLRIKLSVPQESSSPASSTSGTKGKLPALEECETKSGKQGAKRSADSIDIDSIDMRKILGEPEDGDA